MGVLAQRVYDKLTNGRSKAGLDNDIQTSTTKERHQAAFLATSVTKVNVFTSLPSAS